MVVGEIGKNFSINHPHQIAGMMLDRHLLAEDVVLDDHRSGPQLHNDANEAGEVIRRG